MSIYYRFVGQKENIKVWYMSDLVDMIISEKHKVEEIYISCHKEEKEYECKYPPSLPSSYPPSENDDDDDMERERYSSYDEHIRDDYKEEYEFDMDTWISDFDIEEFKNLKILNIEVTKDAHPMRLKSMDKCVLLEYVNLYECIILEFNINKLKLLKSITMSKGYIYIHHEDEYLENFVVIQNLEHLSILTFIDCVLITDLDSTIFLRNLPCLEVCTFEKCLLKNFHIVDCPKIRSLGVQHNKLTSLDLSTISSTLQMLYCSFNNLTSLDVSKCKYLTTLSLDSNKLTYLDVSKSQLLSTLDCSCNELKFLKVDTCWSLWYLDCQENKLEKLPTLPTNTITFEDIVGKTNTKTKKFNFKNNHIMYIPYFLRKHKYIKVPY